MANEATAELDAQYRQLREECGLLDRWMRGKLRLQGADTAAYLQSQLTNDVEALGSNTGCYAVLLDRKGHVQADMRVLRLAPEIFWIDTETEGLAATRRHLETYKIGHEVELEDLEIKNRTGGWEILSLIGPRSVEIAGTPPLAEYASKGHPQGGAASLAVGTSTGIDLLVAGDEADGLRDALLAAGAAEVSEEAAEILRIEAGVPRFGAEMDTGTMPAEAGIVERAVSFSKGCYIGQETVARLHYRGKPNRHLRGLRLSAPAAAGSALSLGDKEVGHIGSSCVSPAHGPIALAILRREAAPGDELSAGEDGVTARVVDLPFV